MYHQQPNQYINILLLSCVVVSFVSFFPSSFLFHAFVLLFFMCFCHDVAAVPQRLRSICLVNPILLLLLFCYWVGNTQVVCVPVGVCVNKISGRTDVHTLCTYTMYSVCTFVRTRSLCTPFKEPTHLFRPLPLRKLCLFSPHRFSIISSTTSQLPFIPVSNTACINTRVTHTSLLGKEDDNSNEGDGYDTSINSHSQEASSALLRPVPSGNGDSVKSASKLLRTLRYLRPATLSSLGPGGRRGGRGGGSCGRGEGGVDGEREEEAAVFVVGLGNPGKEHSKNRHNIGRMVLQSAVRSFGCQFHDYGNIISAQVARASFCCPVFAPKTEHRDVVSAVKAGQVTLPSVPGSRGGTTGGGWEGDEVPFKVCYDIDKRGVVYFMQPQKFINLSGDTIKAAQARLGLQAAQCLVITDDIHTPLGRCKYRFSKYSGHITYAPIV
eukprot:GHVQ01013217.1.p1 GENE.GHVQ01013217.1~~GHVQ01013217.1.p1  ORF type:complete len:438 (+),score=64.89 GHVQ01013217.1:258-1571(+)